MGAKGAHWSVLGWAYLAQGSPCHTSCWLTRSKPYQIVPILKPIRMRFGKSLNRQDMTHFALNCLGTGENIIIMCDSVTRMFRPLGGASGGDFQLHHPRGTSHEGHNRKNPGVLRGAFVSPFLALKLALFPTFLFKMPGLTFTSRSGGILII